MDIEWVFPEGIHELFTSWRPPTNNGIMITFWNFLLPYIFWGIWKERNDRIFRNKESSCILIFHKIKRVVMENIWLTRKFQEPVEAWEVKVFKDWKLDGMKDQKSRVI